MPAPPQDDSDPLGFLYRRIDYERTPPASAREFKLHVMRTLLERLGNPHLSQKVVHIAGTKGKGSTAAMIAAALQAAGLRTALYTSPHLESLHERLAINGQPCEPAEFAQLIESVRGPVADLDRESEAAGLPGAGPTFFDIVTALAFLHFARQRCDATVLEVGMGGRLDSTNICHPTVSVITTISFDHTQQLGNTLAAIAGEKAGIIKPGVPVVSGVIPAEPRQVIARVAQEQSAPLFALEQAFGYVQQPNVPATALPPGPLAGATIDYWEPVRHTSPPHSPSHAFELRDVAIRLRGAHQALNAAVALATLQRLREAGWNLPESSIREGLANAACPARVEVVGESPAIILDAAHNVASIQALLETLDRDFPNRPRIVVFAVNRDKDVAGILQMLLPACERVILTQFQNSPRALPLPELRELAERIAETQPHHSPILETEYSSPTAVRRARQLASPQHVVCVTGSFFLAAEVREAAAG